MLPGVIMGLKDMLRPLLRRLPVSLRCKLVELRAPAGPRRGHGSFVHRSVQFLGRANVVIGENSVLSEDCWLNVNHRIAGKVAIEIGSNCFVGRRNFFSSGALVRLDDFVLTANDCQFLGSTHLVDDPMLPVMTTGTSDTAAIVVGANTFVGAGVRVIGNVTIGHGCVIGAASVVTRSMPPFSQAHGSPAQVRRRFSTAKQAWIDVAQFTEQDEQALPTEEAYVRRLMAHGRINMPYLAAGGDMGHC